MQRALENGDYASDADIVTDALRLWEQREDGRLLHVDLLKQAYAKGKASGEGQSIDRAAFLSELKAERAARGGLPPHPSC